QLRLRGRNANANSYAERPEEKEPGECRPAPAFSSGQGASRLAVVRAVNLRGEVEDRVPVVARESSIDRAHDLRSGHRVGDIGVVRIELSGDRRSQQNLRRAVQVASALKREALGHRRVRKNGTA